MNHDLSLVREYATSQSEPAFATLVERHVALVHSAARRQVEDAELAREITQAVFIILARKAGSLGPDTILSAWLYRTVGFVAAELRRSDRRRRQREHEAYMQSTLNQPPTGPWEQLSPWLDTAMARLNERDRTVLLLRFFENKSAPEIAAALKVNEEAAQKRVVRALEKLRKLFGKSGVTMTTAVIAGAMAANSVQAAPASLATNVALIAATKGAAVSGSTLTLIQGTMKLMTWTKIKMVTAITVASLFVAGATTMVIADLAQSGQGKTGILPPDTFVTAAGSYQWTNASAVGELILRNNQLRSITLGTSPVPPADARIVDRWTNAASTSTLTIKSHAVDFETSDGSRGSSTGVHAWNPGPNWFVYRSSGMRLWAYDDNHGLWMLTATPQGSESRSIEYLQEEPPDAVRWRLPDAVIKLMPQIGK